MSAATPTDPAPADPSLYAIHFDNHEVRAIREPASLAIILAAAVGCLAGRDGRSRGR